MTRHFASPETRSLRLGLAVLAAVAGLAAGASAVPAPVLTPAQALKQQAYLAQHLIRPGQFKPRYLVKPPYVPGALNRMRSALVQPMSAVNTVPFWTTKITSPTDHKTYTVNMVGSSPYATTPANTSVTYVPIVLRLHMAGGVVIDPTAPGPCDTVSPANRFFSSPLFQPATNISSNGVNLSPTSAGVQLMSAFQRANFWKNVHGTNYGVTLVPSRSTPIVVDWTPYFPNDRVVGVPASCSTTANPVNESMPLVEINEYDAEMQLIAALYATPKQIPITLSLDTGIYQTTTNNCCILGYHNAIPFPKGIQLYATGTYFDTKHAIGNGDYVDITTWAHELGELIDDPFVQSITTVPGGVNDDLTPAWGPDGQVSGCQNNLEVGDPLSPEQVGNYKSRAIKGAGGFVYHYQDLAFHDWFYRTPSTGTGGKFSLNGNFTADAGALC